MSGETRHLLVVDDDDRIRALLKTFLTRQGYRVSAAAHAGAARALMRQLQFDLAVVDVMMPGQDGFAFVSELRASSPPASTTPVIFLSARGAADDRIAGLSLGADDYLGKPFEPRELVLRIEAVLRRRDDYKPGSDPVRLGALTFVPLRGELLDGHRSLRLTEAEVRLLRRLAQAPNQVVRREHLIGDEADASGRAVDIQVTRLRRKLEPDPANPRYLRTARGSGYMLTPD